MFGDEETAVPNLQLSCVLRTGDARTEERGFHYYIDGNWYITGGAGSLGAGADLWT